MNSQNYIELLQNNLAPTNSDSLYGTLEFIWNDVMANEQYRKTLAYSMRNRMKDHSLNSGGYTKY